MDDFDHLNLDYEFKRYLQILRPYLGQLTNKTVITICNAWIRRLAESDDSEKSLRNKYVFALCYQLAKGHLEDPFINPPPTGSLKPINDSLVDDDSSSEMECLIIEPDDHTDANFNKVSPISDSDYLSQTNDYGNLKSESRRNLRDCASDTKSIPNSKKTILSFNHLETMAKLRKYSLLPDMYETRANNLISKLREIKTENVILHNELLSIKRESNSKYENCEEDDVIKVGKAGSSYVVRNESNSTLKCLKYKLHEIQESRNNLIDKIGSLQDQLDNYQEIKKHEIENLEAKHKLDIMNVKSAVREEIKNMYEKTIEDLKTSNDEKIREIESQKSREIQDLKIELEGKNKTISLKDIEIKNLNNQVDDLKIHLHSVLEKFIDKPTENMNNENNKLKTQQLEKRLNRMEKSKIRCTRIYEAKLAQMQREKHLAECSLQLQMVRQRAQVVNEATDENQTELATALDKLETKYKEIVANVQATAIQRRMQDQLSLESILQAASGIPNENNNPLGTNQFSKTMRNQNRSYDAEFSPLSRCNKVGNIGGGNKSFGEDSLVTGYCLNSERMGELFERVCIPQRDNPETK